MANQTLENIVSYIETKLATISLLKQVEYTDSEDQPPLIREYGAHIFLPEEDSYESERRYIGAHLNETWNIRVDIIINRHFQTQRKAVSDARGTSYWKALITELFLNGTNSGVFESSKWEFSDYDTNADIYKLKGIFSCELLNTY